MIAGTLELQLLANLARISKDMSDAKGIVGTATKSMEGSVASLKSALGALGIGLSVVGLGNLIKGSIDALDHLNDLSKSTNLAVDTLAGLKVAAKQSGGDIDSIAASINKLSVEMGKAPEKFRALGITAKDPLEAFKQLADVFNRIVDPQQRAALAATALGKSWAGAAPLLAEGSRRISEMVAEGTKVSGVTADMAKQADALNDKFTLLVGSGGMLTRMVGPLLPLLNQLADDMLKASDKTSGFAASFSPLLETMKAIIILGSDVSFVFQTIGKDIARAVENAKLIAKGDFAGSKALGELFKKDAEEARQALDEYQKKIMSIGVTGAVPGGMRLGSGPPGGRANVDRVPTDEATKQAQAFLDAAEIEAKAKKAAADLARENAQWAHDSGARQFDEDMKHLEEKRKLTAETTQLAAELGMAASEAIVKQQEAAQAVREEFQEKQASDLKSLTDSLMTETEVRKFAYEKDFNLLNDTLGMKADAQQQYYTLMQRLVLRNSLQEQEIERSKHAALRSMQMQTWQLGAELLQSVAGESQAAAIAVIAIHKGLAIAEVIVNTQAAIARGYAELGPVAGSVNAARMQALMGLQVGIIAATGLVQASQVGGGGADIGSPANPVNTTDSFGSAGSNAAPAAGSNQTTVIHLHGETYSRKQVKMLIDKINEETKQGGGRIVVE